MNKKWNRAMSPLGREATTRRLASAQSDLIIENLSQLPSKALIDIGYFLSPIERIVTLLRVSKQFKKALFQSIAFEDLWILPQVPTYVLYISTVYV